MSAIRRTQRMASLIRSEIARCLIEEIADPGLKELTITDVELSNDLKHACVFFTGHESEVTVKAEKQVQQGFHRASPFFKRKLSDNLQLRFIPELEFKRDVHGDSLNRLMHLFDDLHADPSGAGPGSEKTN